MEVPDEKKVEKLEMNKVSKANFPIEKRPGPFSQKWNFMTINGFKTIQNAYLLET